MFSHSPALSFSGIYSLQYMAVLYSHQHCVNTEGTDSNPIILCSSAQLDAGIRDVLGPLAASETG
jgi:hypothetical protein